MSGAARAGVRMDNGILRRLWKEEAGQTATEYMLLVSVVVIGVVAAAYVFIPQFKDGVANLAGDVSTILDCGKIGTGDGCR